MSFLYFLPGVLDVPQQGGDFVFDFGPFGLGLSLADVKSSPADATAFGVRIDGVSGALVIPHVNGAPPKTLAYQPEKQTWLWVQVGDQKVGIGFEKLPTPSSLARPKNYEGYEVEDATGSKWVIPIAREGGRTGVTLPSEYSFDPITLQATATPSSAFDELWKISGEIYDHWNLSEFTLPTNVMALYALKALAVNYRVGPLELSAFAAAGSPVLNDQVIYFVGLALIDWQRKEEVKKNEKD